VPDRVHTLADRSRQAQSGAAEAGPVVVNTLDVDALVHEIRDEKNPAEWRIRCFLQLDTALVEARARGQTFFAFKVAGVHGRRVTFVTDEPEAVALALVLPVPVRRQHRAERRRQARGDG
jgi:hypothetical protein